MKTAISVLLILCFGLAVFVTGCGFLAGQVQAVDEDGNLKFLDAQGNETTVAIDPETGHKNEPLMEYAEDGGLPAKGAKLVKGLPSPWGELLAGGLSVVATG